MTGFYDRAAATAMRLLSKYGSSWTFTTTNDDGSTTKRDAMGAFISTVRSELGNSGVAIGDRKYIFTSDAAPVNGDTFTNGTQKWVVRWSDAVGDTPAAFYVWGRAG